MDRIQKMQKSHGLKRKKKNVFFTLKFQILFAREKEKNRTIRSLFLTIKVQDLCANDVPPSPVNIQYIASKSRGVEQPNNTENAEIR